MEVYRLSREKFASTLSGKGAALKGARWNSIGVELIYTAGNRSLAMAEVAVPLRKVTLSELPADWSTFPHPTSTQEIGDRFVSENRYGILQIPSAVTYGDYNILINPNHSEFKRIKILDTEHFPFDKRIFK